MEIAVLGAGGDIGRSFVGWCESSGIRVVQAPREMPIEQRLDLLLAGSRPLVNLAGKNRPSQPTTEHADKLFIANVWLPVAINNASQRTGSTVVHLSTGELDTSPPDRELSRGWLLEAEGHGPSHEGLTAFARQVDWRGADAYLMSKAILEAHSAQFDNALCVRLSNVFGAGYRRLGFIPRAIDARIRGVDLTIPNERRNWCHSAELNAFLVWAALDPPSAGVIPAYGSHDLSSAEIIALVEELLPTCYGRASLDSMRIADVSHPELRRLESYTEVPRISTEAALWETIRFWRQITRFSPDATSIEAAPDMTPQQRRVHGGSIAQKSLSKRTITKSSRQNGFEGAGAAKLAAEVDFYLSLRQPTNAELRPLFPELLSYSVEPGHTSMTLELIGDGSTLADVLSGEQDFSVEAVERLMNSLMRHSYLKDLNPLGARESQRFFDTAYVGRTADRLSSFKNMTGYLTVDARLGEAITAVVHGESLTINGARVRSPISNLSEIAKLRSNPLLPRTMGPCGHGDLTVLNFAVETPTRLRLIDPRGFVGKWDPAYDLGKFAFSLSGFAECMKNGLTVNEHNGAFELPSATLPLGYRQGLDWLSAWTAHSDQLAALRDAEPDLGLRIQFAEACHYLADVPYRLVQGMDSDRALAVLLLGCALLADVAAKIGIGD